MKLLNKHAWETTEIEFINKVKEEYKNLYLDFFKFKYDDTTCFWFAGVGEIDGLVNGKVIYDTVPKCYSKGRTPELAFKYAKKLYDMSKINR